MGIFPIQTRESQFSSTYSLAKKGVQRVGNFHSIRRGKSISIPLSQIFGTGFYAKIREICRLLYRFGDKLLESVSKSGSVATMTATMYESMQAGPDSISVGF
jgi:hypothetical protein